jgi:hypothetical protein
MLVRTSDDWQNLFVLFTISTARQMRCHAGERAKTECNPAIRSLRYALDAPHCGRPLEADRIASVEFNFESEAKLPLGV